MLKTITISIIYIYAALVLFVLYGVAMGFIASDSQDLISQSIRAIVALF